MKKICLVTYTRSEERFTDELDKIAYSLYSIYKNDFKLVICCERKIEMNLKPYCVEQIELSGTKYSRLIKLLEQDNSEYFLSIDNDITGNMSELLAFVDSMIKGKYEVGWGRIQARSPKEFISNMVAVDKLLSHNLIRPFLWKTGFGISIPGQVFCIRGASFRGNLMQLDTFLDDLALGLYVNVNHSRKFVTSSILGFEEPSSKFINLWEQRKRWAIGYASILKGISDNKEYSLKVSIHGFSYHFLWILHWVCLAALVLNSWWLAFIYVLGIAFLISRKDMFIFLYAIIYQLVFPIFHIRWGASFFKEIIKGE